MSAASARKAGNVSTGNANTPPPPSESFNTEPVSSRQMKVALFTVGEDQFAVLSVPLDEGPAMAALSHAEREVAVLAARGLRNAEIARHRGTSVRTVANQMASILRKVGVSSRYELAAHLARYPLGEGDR